MRMHSPEGAASNDNAARSNEAENPSELRDLDAQLLNLREEFALAEVGELPALAEKIVTTARQIQALQQEDATEKSESAEIPKAA